MTLSPARTLISSTWLHTMSRDFPESTSSLDLSSISPQHPISSSLELLHGHRSKLPIVLQHPEFQIFPTSKLLLGCSIHFRNNHKTGLLLLIEMGFCKGALTCKNHIYWCPASLTFCRKNSDRASKVWETFLLSSQGVQFFTSNVHANLPFVFIPQLPGPTFEWSSQAATQTWGAYESSFYIIWWREMECWISVYWAHYGALPS